MSASMTKHLWRWSTALMWRWSRRSHEQERGDNAPASALSWPQPTSGNGSPPRSRMEGGNRSVFVHPVTTVATIGPPEYTRWQSSAADIDTRDNGRIPPSIRCHRGRDNGPASKARSTRWWQCRPHEVVTMARLRSM
jgi:hypothetical protein